MAGPKFIPPSPSELISHYIPKANVNPTNTLFQIVIKVFKVRLILHYRASRIPELPGPLSGPWTPAAIQGICFSPRGVDTGGGGGGAYKTIKLSTKIRLNIHNFHFLRRATREKFDIANRVSYWQKINIGKSTCQRASRLSELGNCSIS